MAASGVTVGSNKYGMDAEFFTRGQVGDADTRGGSMVQKHLEMLQVEKENQSLGQLAAMCPDYGAAIRVVVLQECSWDVQKAANMLSRFAQDYADELKTIQKKRKQINDRAEHAAQQTAAENMAKASSSNSDDSDNNSGSSSDSDSEGDRLQKRSKKSQSKKSKDKKSKKSKGKRKSKKEKKEKKVKDGKRHKADKKTTNTVGGDAENFGRFGIIKEADMLTKHAEFMAWAVEVKKVNVETMSRPDEKELFRDFMEDFNTGTMPHRKYYNLDVYEREKAAKLAKKGITTTSKRKAALDDEQEVRRQRAVEVEREKELRLQAAYQELMYSDKAKDMKEQELLRLQMQQAYKTGDKEKAAKILRRLEPEKEK